MIARDEDSHLVLGFVALAPCGKVLRDCDLKHLVDWDAIKAHRANVAAGLPHAAAMKIGTAMLGSDYEHSYLALLRNRRKGPLRPSELQLLEECWRDLASALERARVPIIASEPFLLQVAKEKKLGLTCVDSFGSRIYESNSLAHIYAAHYGPVLGSFNKNNSLQEFVCSLLRKGSLYRSPVATRQLLSISGRRVLNVRRHMLDKQTHGLNQDAVLVVMQELEIEPHPGIRVLSAFPKRLREVGYYLAFTGLSHAQIASLLGVGRRTVGTHVRRLFEKMNVRTREALTERLSRY